MPHILHLLQKYLYYSWLFVFLKNFVVLLSVSKIILPGIVCNIFEIMTWFEKY